MIKIVDTRIPSAPPGIMAAVPTAGKAGETLVFSARRKETRMNPCFKLHGISAMEWKRLTSERMGSKPDHAYTLTFSGSYTVHAQAVGIGGAVNDQSFPITISGAVPTKFVPEEKQSLSNGKP